MFDTHNNVATFWLVIGFRKLEVYKADIDAREASNSHPLIVEEML